MSDYRFEPETFSNRAIVDIEVIENAGILLGGTLDKPAELIVNLSALIETIILNESIILTGNDSRGVFDSDDYHSTETMDLINELTEKDIIDGQALHIIDDEIKTYHELKVEEEVNRIKSTTEGRSVVKIAYNHTYGDPYEPKNQEEYIDALYNITRELMPKPWDKVAEDHGIPYSSEPFYSASAMNKEMPTSISFELYNKLEELNKEYFKKIKKYLGRSYVRLPSLLSIVLNECDSQYDITKTVIEMREQFSNFRIYCTNMEVDLRMASTMNDQVQIINEIELAYENTFNKFKEKNEKSRVIYKTFDTVKSMNPLKIGMNILDLAKDYDIEQQGLLKIPAYYDLWKASLDVEQSLNSIDRLYGKATSNRIIKEMDSESWSV